MKQSKIIESLQELLIISYLAGQKSAGGIPDEKEAKDYITARLSNLSKAEPVKKSSEEIMKECYSCKYKSTVPGNEHIMCNNPDPLMQGSEHGIKNGWFIYPLLFDPAWKLTACNNYEKK